MLTLNSTAELINAFIHAGNMPKTSIICIMCTTFSSVTYTSYTSRKHKTGIFGYVWVWQGILEASTLDGFLPFALIWLSHSLTMSKYAMDVTYLDSREDNASTAAAIFRRDLSLDKLGIGKRDIPCVDHDSTRVKK